MVGRRCEDGAANCHVATDGVFKSSFPSSTGGVDHINATEFVTSQQKSQNTSSQSMPTSLAASPGSLSDSDAEPPVVVGDSDVEWVESFEETALERVSKDVRRADESTVLDTISLAAAGSRTSQEESPEDLGQFSSAPVVAAPVPLIYSDAEAPQEKNLDAVSVADESTCLDSPVVASCLSRFLPAPGVAAPLSISDSETEPVEEKGLNGAVHPVDEFAVPDMIPTAGSDTTKSLEEGHQDLSQLSPAPAVVEPISTSDADGLAPLNGAAAPAHESAASDIIPTADSDIMTSEANGLDSASSQPVQPPLAASDVTGTSDVGTEEELVRWFAQRGMFPFADTGSMPPEEESQEMSQETSSKPSPPVVASTSAPAAGNVALEENARRLIALRNAIEENAFPKSTSWSSSDHWLNQLCTRGDLSQREASSCSLRDRVGQLMGQAQSLQDKRSQP